MRRRSAVIASLSSVAASWPKMRIMPRVGRSDSSISLQQRRLAGARRAGEELKALRRDGEIEVAHDLGADAIAQADIFKAQQRRASWECALNAALTMNATKCQSFQLRSERADSPCSSFAEPAPVHTTFPTRFSARAPREFRCVAMRRQLAADARTQRSAVSAASTRGALPRLERAPRPRATLTPRLRRLAGRIAAPLALAGVLAADGRDRRARDDRRRRPARGGRLCGDRPSGQSERAGDRGRAARVSSRAAARRRLSSRARSSICARGRRRRRRCGSRCAAPTRASFTSGRRARPRIALAPRERAHFAARLAAPPEGANDALVKFVAPGDKIAPNTEGS